jgi:hypothetical protein
VLARRGAGEVVLIGERHEVSELAQIHKLKVYVPYDNRLGLLNGEQPESMSHPLLPDRVPLDRPHTPPVPGARFL